MIHLPARHVLTAEDWSMIREIGVVPILGLSLYPLSDWHMLRELGFEDVTLRLWHGWGTLPKPERYLDAHSVTIGWLVKLGFSVAVAPVTEPNLELAGMGLGGFTAWLEEFIPLFQQRYPKLELVSPALSPNDNYTPWEWLEGLRRAFAKCDTLGVHFYWQNTDDLKSNASFSGRTAPWSPEWWRGQFPQHDQRITECGGADGTTREWRRVTYPGMFKLWRGLPYVKSIHPFVMSAEDGQWEQKGHTYDAEVVAILRIAAQAWWKRGQGKKEEKKVATLAEQFSDLYQQWVEAGGIDANFRKHLLGSRVIKATPDDLKMLAAESIASATQLKNALVDYPFP